jgi:hypothetical protein
MKTKVTKHAKGLYLISFETHAHQQYNSDWLPLSNLCDFPEYRDLKKLLLMEKSGGDTAIMTFKTNYENFELVVAILEDNKYYDLTEMKNVLNLMENK